MPSKQIGLIFTKQMRVKISPVRITSSENYMASFSATTLSK